MYSYNNRHGEDDKNRHVLGLFVVVGLENILC